MSRLSQIKNLFSTTESRKPNDSDKLRVPTDCTLFHITHWKAGSQWIKAVVDDLFASEDIVPAENFEAQVLNRPIDGGKAYTCVYLGKAEFDALKTPGARRQFFVIRDLRDALISGYFSIRYTHSIETGPMDKWRRVLTSLDQESGILYLLEVWLPMLADIQRSWFAANEPFYRLEDFAGHEFELFEKIFRERWKVSVPPEKLKEVLTRRSFEKMAGHERGKEDLKSHYRKGIAGDWKQHFTPKIVERFKVLHNDLLLAGRYESDRNWTA